MKTLARIIVVAAGVAVAVPVTNAAETAAPAAKPAAAGKHPRLRALMAHKAVRERVAHRLGLTADQTAKLKDIRAKAAAEVKSIRADNSLTKEQKKAKAREALQAARTETQSVLTPDQQAKIHKFRQHLRQRRGAI